VTGLAATRVTAPAISTGACATREAAATATAPTAISLVTALAAVTTATVSALATLLSTVMTAMLAAAVAATAFTLRTRALLRITARRMVFRHVGSVIGTTGAGIPAAMASAARVVRPAATTMFGPAARILVRLVFTRGAIGGLL
jgi:hypothetical protein